MKRIKAAAKEKNKTSQKKASKRKKSNKKSDKAKLQYLDDRIYELEVIAAERDRHKGKLSRLFDQAREALKSAWEQISSDGKVITVVCRLIAEIVRLLDRGT